jgi:hypothetical protein
MQAAAALYMGWGWPLIAIAPIDGRPVKKPTDKDWPRKLLASGAVSTLGQAWNIGLLLRDLCDVDLDVREAQAAASAFLPATGLVYGHASNPGSHFLYSVSSPLPYKKFVFGAERGDLLELRSMMPSHDGTEAKAFQSLLPPSTHPNGELYEWRECDKAGVVEAKTLWRAVHLLAVTAALAILHPAMGDEHKAARDEFRLAISGMLARRLAEEEARKVFLEALRIAGDRKDRKSIFQSTVDKLRRGGEVKGIPALIALVGDHAVNSILGWIDSIGGDKAAPASIAGEMPGEASAEIPGRYPVTEVSNGERLAARFKDEIKYASDRRVWCGWTGDYWKVPDSVGMQRRMQVVAREIYTEAAREQDEGLRKALSRWAVQSEGEHVQMNSIEAARPHVETDWSLFDADTTVLGCTNLTVQLREGKR